MGSCHSAWFLYFFEVPSTGATQVCQIDAAAPPMQYMAIPEAVAEPASAFPTTYLPHGAVAYQMPGQAMPQVMVPTPRADGAARRACNCALAAQQRQHRARKRNSNQSALVTQQAIEAALGAAEQASAAAEAAAATAAANSAAMAALQRVKELGLPEVSVTVAPEASATLQTVSTTGDVSAAIAENAPAGSDEDGDKESKKPPRKRKKTTTTPTTETGGPPADAISAAAAAAAAAASYIDQVNLPIAIADAELVADVDVPEWPVEAMAEAVAMVDATLSAE